MCNNILKFILSSEIFRLVYTYMMHICVYFRTSYMNVWNETLSGMQFSWKWNFLTKIFFNCVMPILHGSGCVMWYLHVFVASLMRSQFSEKWRAIISQSDWKHFPQICIMYLSGICLFVGLKRIIIQWTNVWPKPLICAMVLQRIHQSINPIVCRNPILAMYTLPYPVLNFQIHDSESVIVCCYCLMLYDTPTIQTIYQGKPKCDR